MVDMDDPVDALNTLKLSNASRFQQLMQQGLQIDPQSILMARINILIELFLDEQEKLRFEMKFENAVSEMLTQAEQQLSRVKLTSPLLSQTPGLPMDGLLSPDGRPFQ